MFPFLFETRRMRVAEGMTFRIVCKVAAFFVTEVTKLLQEMNGQTNDHTQDINGWTRKFTNQD